jgi:G6PDH family F420-dependent oxidoreductase
MRFGYFLACEEFGPDELLDQARQAQDAGFDALWISDHFHPWNEAQGHSPFVWSVIGALAQVCELPVTTAVTCPTIRTHPAIIAQAAATSAVMHQGRFRLGVGSGEALNEHVLGDRWPSIDLRLEMLEESIEVMRELWAGGFVTRHGRHYAVEHAKIYTLPERPPPVYVSGFGPKAIELAGRIGDGYVGVSPDSELVQRFRDAGGGTKPAQGGFKVCVAKDEAAGREIAHRLWPNMGVPGELAQVLPSPLHFEQASELVTPEMVGDIAICGPDPGRHVKQARTYIDAGYDEVYVANIGPNQKAFMSLWRDEVLPELRRG